MWIGSASSSTCNNSTAGIWLSAVGSSLLSICTNCNVGSWPSLIGTESSVSCICCPSGTWSSGVGSSSFMTCGLGSWHLLVMRIGFALSSACNISLADIWLSAMRSSLLSICTNCNVNTCHLVIAPHHHLGAISV